VRINETVFKRDPLIIFIFSHDIFDIRTFEIYDAPRDKSNGHLQEILRDVIQIRVKVLLV